MVKSSTLISTVLRNEILSNCLFIFITISVIMLIFEKNAHYIHENMQHTLTRKDVTDTPLQTVFF